MSVHDSSLGEKTDYPQRYAPDVLLPIARSEARSVLDLSEPLPFRGEDIWNAWELTWLSSRGRPMVATCEIRVPADSPNLIESKSLKLYLGSFAMTRVESPQAVINALSKDLSAAAGAAVTVNMNPSPQVRELDGDCIDEIDVACSTYDVDPELLRVDADNVVTEHLHSHLLRSLCPVTSQPDIGSVQFSYTGPRIDRETLLRYVVSFRQHNDFHEACIERMFADIARQCRPEALTVFARYQRRGGIDINPWRSNSDASADNPRLWRQ